jgi:hypothetical protein
VWLSPTGCYEPSNLPKRSQKLGNPTVMIVVDRIDLDTQITSTFVKPIEAQIFFESANVIGWLSSFGAILTCVAKLL